MTWKAWAATPLLMALAACATTEGEPPAPPNLAPTAGAPANARAKLYADCVGQSAATATYDISRDDSTNLIRFRCVGAPARAFFDALGPRSAAVGSEWSAEGRTWRSTNKVQRNLFGVDYCSANATGEAECALTMNAGGFLVE